MIGLLLITQLTAPVAGKDKTANHTPEDRKGKFIHKIIKEYRNHIPFDFLQKRNFWSPANNYA